MVLEPLTPERRRQQTRDYLLAAAAQVFAERGFHGASLDEVAAVAGFTKGAVYSNFKNKDDLFLAVLESRYDSEMATLRATLASSEGPPEDNLSDFVEFVRAELNDDVSGGHWASLYQEFCLYAMRNPQARQKLARLQQAEVDSIAEIIAAERIRHGIEGAEPPEHAARIVSAMMRGLFASRLIDPAAVDDALVESTLNFLARALTPTIRAGRPAGKAAGQKPRR